MSKPKAATARSSKSIVLTWIGAVLSAGLLYIAAVIVMASLKSFRSCNANDAGLTVSSCGKQSLNVGDFILFGLLVLAALLFVSMATAAWRTTRRAEK